MVICLQRGADLHIALPVPLPLTGSSSCKIQRAVKRVCVCTCSPNSSLTLVRKVSGLIDNYNICFLPTYKQNCMNVQTGTKF